MSNMVSGAILKVALADFGADRGRPLAEWAVDQLMEVIQVKLADLVAVENSSVRAVGVCCPTSEMYSQQPATHVIALLSATHLGCVAALPGSK